MSKSRSASAASCEKPVIAIEVRPDLVAGEWAMLLRQPVWAVVATPAFGEMLRVSSKTCAASKTYT